MTNQNDDMLDGLFAQARTETPLPSDDLIARVLADADVVQSTNPATLAKPQPGLMTRILDALGGWPAVSGLAVATVAGIWIGIAPPTSMQDMTANYLGDEVSVSLFPSDLDFDVGDFADG